MFWFNKQNNHRAGSLPDQTKFLKSLPPGHRVLDPAVRREMIDMARTFARKAYAPYSNFHVGAALLTRDGQRFGGANVEAARAEGLVCGERNAIVTGVAAGMAYNRLDVIDIISVTCADLPENMSVADGSPCGACRQVIREFSHPDTVVIIDDKKTGVLARVSDLLPESFMFGKAVPKSGAARTLTSSEIIIPKDISREMAVAALDMLAENSYAPLTGIEEAATVVNADGQGFSAVQVDNSSTGLSISALRGAFNRAAIFGGAKKIDKVVVVQKAGPKGKFSPLLSMINPALLNEFGHDDTRIILANGLKLADFRWGRIKDIPAAAL